MNCPRTLDAIVRSRLKLWPQHPPGLARRAKDAWLRGRPDPVPGQCFLKLPGSHRLRTLPDGLWLNFGGTAAEPYVDVFAIEACASLANLLDKRARFAPSTQSLMAVCPLNWLLDPAISGGTIARWQITGVLPDVPSHALVLPVRDMRVMYALQSRHFNGLLETQVPQAHEFFVPMDVLTAKDGDQAPALQALVARISVHANFFVQPEAPV